MDIVNVLADGGVILFPTDTIWGLGCRIDNIDAVKRIFVAKNRDFNKPLPILVSSIEMLKRYAVDIHPRIETLLEFHQYPLTIIYPKSNQLAPPVCHQNGSIAIRIVKDEFCKKLINALNVPIVATSANYSNEPFPENFSQIDERLKNEVDMVVDFRQKETLIGKPSIIATYDREGELEFIRS